MASAATGGAALKIKLVKVEAGLPASVTLPAAFDAALREKADAIFVLPDEPMFFVRRADIVALAARHRLPAFYGAREFVDDGGLMSYGENLRAAYRSAAIYLARWPRARTRANFRCSSRPGSNWSSTAGRPSRSASACRRRCCSVPTK